MLSDAQISRFHRLSALDSAFLAIEDDRSLMHIGATALFEPGSWVDERGRIDEARYLRYAETVLNRLPKWRQRVARVPVLRHPVLVPDAEFDLTRHVRFVHLARGTLGDVERLAGEHYARKLNREHPLWEIVVVDGLEERRFATIIKLHHCMADGVAGFGSLIAMLGPTPDPSIACVPEAPRPEPPTARELLEAELRFRASEPRAIVEYARSALARPESMRRAAGALAGVISAVRLTARRAPPTPFNPRRLGPRRAYRGVRFDLEEVKNVRRAAGAKLNDVVLATVATALDRYFEALGAPVRRELRCLVPVSLHRAGSSDLFGNEVSAMIVPLPVGSMTARKRLELVVQGSKQAKLSHESDAFAWGEHLAEWTLVPLIPWAIRLVAALRPFNVIVTNVQGPPVPFYLGDAKLIGVYPLVPLYRNQTLAIALVSYDGSLFWGINADPDHVRDVDRLASLLREAFVELRDAYRVAQSQGFR